MRNTLQITLTNLLSRIDFYQSFILNFVYPNTHCAASCVPLMGLTDNLPDWRQLNNNNTADWIDPGVE